MFKRGVAVVFAHGVVRGVVRVVMALLVVCALAGACWGMVSWLSTGTALLVAVLGGLGIGWRELVRAVFWPDSPDAYAEVGPVRWVGLVVLRLLMSWVFWTFLLIDVDPRAGLIAGLPLAASAVQRVGVMARGACARRGAA